MSSTPQVKSDRLRSVLLLYFKMLVIGVALTLLAIFSANFFNNFYPLSGGWKTFSEYFGYICWVVSLGENGLKQMSWTNSSWAEALDRRIGQIVSFMGVFAFVFSRELKTL